jgi:hypothetical protein
MRHTVALLALACAVGLATPTIFAESVLANYRGVTLGDSIEVVVEQLKLSAADVKVVHERTALIQELTWRPRNATSGTTTQADSIADIVLTFQAGQLARIGVNYDRSRTQGLTDADLQEAMASVYGPSMLIATPTQPTASSASPRQTIGRWEDAETRLILWREQYPNRVGLIISSIASDARLQQMISDGERLAAAEGPARDLARRTADAAAIQARDEKIRRENKTNFKPN